MRNRNSPPPFESMLVPGSVHLWIGSLSIPPERLQPMAETLSPEENHRAKRFHFPVHRDRFIAGRGLLRLILARYTSRPPSALRFHLGSHEKPELDPPGGICFNVAHSEDRLLIAVGLRPVGVDIEKWRTIPELNALAAEVFSDAELACWRNMAQTEESFLGLWTRKEALLKGIGLGITQHLKNVSVFFDDSWKTIVPRELSREEWTLKTCRGVDAIWSVAVPCHPLQIETFQIRAEEP